ncbi:MAG: acyclic terpene utilization AtuA family protein [Acidimicrobiales bacterium]
MSRPGPSRPGAKRPLVIANCSGFFGDRFSAAREMVESGPIDVLTGDYLAELTMMILWKARRRDPEAGFAGTFLAQMEETLGACLDRGVKVVTNAGGLNPEGLATALGAMADRLGLAPAIAWITGDDLLGDLDSLQAQGCGLEHLDTGVALSDAGVEPVTANAYLGGWGIAEALAGGADVVVCPRVTDASVVVGPAAWHHGWARDDWDRLAGAVVAGHIIECGTQATGGNYAFFGEVTDRRPFGFPIAEVADDGSCVITKHPGTGGLVSVGTVTAQILYEIAGAAYPNPDVVARFDTVELAQDGPDRVRVFGAKGEPAPPTTKVCINYLGGHRNTMTFVLTGLDIEAKAEMVVDSLFRDLGGRESFAATDVRLRNTARADAPTNEEASAWLQITVKDPDPTKVGRAFSNAVVEQLLAGYPGCYLTSPPASASSYGVFWPALVPAEAIHQVVVHHDGRVVEIPPAGADGRPAMAAMPRSSGDSPGGDSPGGDAPAGESPAAGALEGPTRRLPLGTVIGARSGDKGGNANVGLWARSDAGHQWLRAYLTVGRFRALVPEVEGLEVRRYDFPLLRSLNFVVVGLLGEGVGSSTRPDAQAKSLGEFVRSRVVDLPEALLVDAVVVA